MIITFYIITGIVLLLLCFLLIYGYIRLFQDKKKVVINDEIIDNSDSIPEIVDDIEEFGRILEYSDIKNKQRSVYEFMKNDIGENNG